MSRKHKNTNNSGQALVEFALIIIVLLMLLTMVIELGRIVWAWTSVQSAARNGARYAITGKSEPGICDDQPVGCLARTESVEEEALRYLTGWRIEEDVAFQEDYYTNVEVFGFNSSLSPGEQMQLGFAGEPGQPMVVRVTYNVPIITPLLSQIVENVPVFGQVTLTNELFGQTGGRTEGAALPPPLPALPKIGPTDTPTATFTPTPVPSIPPDATPTETPRPETLVQCDVKIKGPLISGQRILQITGDRFVNNDSGNAVYTLELLDVTNGQIIASGVPMDLLPVELTNDHGCINENEGAAEIDLNSSPGYYINPIYAGGLPGNIVVLAQHENGSEDDEYVIPAADATATVLAPTLTPLPSETPTPTPDVTNTPSPAGPFIAFPFGDNCVNPNPSARFTIFGGNWTAGHVIQFVWDNNEIVGNATTDSTGAIGTMDFDLGVRDSGNHTLSAIDGVTNQVFTMNILIPCPAPIPTETPTATPTLSPPDLIISIPKLVSDLPITEYTSVEFSFAITNTGQTDVNSLFFVDLFLDPPAAAIISETDPITRTYIIADPYSDGFIAIPDMPANSSRVITITSPIGFQNDVTGLREAWGMVDTINQISDEEHEDNNLSSLGNIVVTPALNVPTPTPIPSEESDPYSVRGRVKALYTEFVPQQRASVFLVEQPADGSQGTVIAQTISDANGRYRFFDVPPLTGGDYYTVVACLSLAGSDAYFGSWFPILPDPDEAVFEDVYMTITPTGCSI